MDRQLEQVLSKPATLLSQIGIFRAALSVLRGSEAGSSDRMALGASASFAWTVAPTILARGVDLRRALAASLRSFGVSPGVATRLHAAFSAGLVPIVAGPCARAAVEAYARVVCGSRIVTAHASPTLLEATDLLGRVDPTTGTFVFHPNNLYGMIRSAQGAQGSAVALIEGINRGPTEAYLLPLLEAQSLGLPMECGPLAGTDQHLDGASRKISLPSTVKFAGTVVDGPTSLPVSRDLWTYCVLLEVEACPKSGSTEPASEFPIDGETGGQLEEAGALAKEMSETVPDARSVAPTLLRFANSLVRHEPDKGKVRQGLIEGVLLPQALSAETAEGRDRALETLAKHYETDEERARFAECARRLRRRIA